MGRVRMRDVAEHAGVSVRSVSNVVNGYVHVSPDMRARVQRSLDELGYQMDYLARALKSGRTGFIAMVVPYLDEPYFALLAQAVVRAATERSLGVLVEMTGNDPAAERRILEHGIANIADGVILCHLGHPVDAGPLPPSGFPLVIMGAHCPGPHLDHVGADETAAARTAAEHLIESGRRRIAMIGGGTEGSGRLRYEGYRQALAAAGLEPAGVITPRGAEAGMSAGMTGMNGFLRRAAPLPDAVLAHNDTMAIGVIRSLTAHGCRIPGDVAVIGIDGIAEAAYVTPSLSSVAFDLNAMAGRALDLLDEQTRPGGQPRAPRHVFTPFRLVARESTAPAVRVRV